MSRRRTFFFLVALCPAIGAAARDADYEQLLDAASRARNAAVSELVDRAVERRRRIESQNETQARIAVHRDLAALFAARESWADAFAQIGSALTLARDLGDSHLLIELYLENSGYLIKAQRLGEARLDLDRADAMIGPLGRTAARVESALLRVTALLASRSQPDTAAADAIYERLLAMPEADRFRIVLHRARHTRFDRTREFVERWTAVLEMARSETNREIEAEATDQLGMIAHSQGDHAHAAGDFAAADDLAGNPRRTVAVWLAVVDAYNRVDNRPRAYRTLAAASAVIDPERNPGAAADLHEARGVLLAREQDYAAAYAELDRANQLRRRREATRQILPFARVVPTVRSSDTTAAAELAAVRNALREAELERSRTKLRHSVGTAAVAVLLAALFGLAYAYKRRSAAALAIARANAELRADRTHWQMLRYQLNPHFLFIETYAKK